MSITHEHSKQATGRFGPIRNASWPTTVAEALSLKIDGSEKSPTSHTKVGVVATTPRCSFSYVKEGIGQGRRPELVGGGLIRTVGWWAEANKVRAKGHDRMKGDERILGDGFGIVEKMDDDYTLRGETRGRNGIFV